MDLFSKSNSICMLSQSINGGWQYLSQTECVRDTQDPVFETRLEIDFPLPDQLLRFTIVDGDSCSDLFSSMKAIEGGHSVLGVANLPAKDLISAIGNSIKLTLHRQHAGLHGTPSSDQIDVGASGLGAGTLTVQIEEVTALEAPCVLLLQARSDALHVARRHALAFESARARGQWAGNLRRAIVQARRDHRMQRGVILSMQKPVREFYNSQFIQGSRYHR